MTDSKKKKILHGVSQMYHVYIFLISLSPLKKNEPVFLKIFIFLNLSQINCGTTNKRIFYFYLEYLVS